MEYSIPNFTEICAQKKEELGLTQELIAERAGISQGQVSKILRGIGIANPTDNLARVAEVLEITPPTRFSKKGPMAAATTDLPPELVSLLREIWSKYEGQGEDLVALLAAIRNLNRRNQSE